MNRIDLGTVAEGYEAYMETVGFDHTYYIEEVASGVTNGFDSLEDFSEHVLMIVNPMGYYTLKRYASELLDGLIKDDESEAIKYCKNIGMSDEEMEWLR